MTSKPLCAPTEPANVIDRLAQLGPRYDAAPLFPGESLRILQDAGFHGRFAPDRAGGERFTDEQTRYANMRDALRLVGRGDLSVGRLYEGHVNALLLFEWYATTQQIAWLGEALDRGAWFGVWATEPPPGVRLSDGDPPMLFGAKIFASGAGGIDYALVTVAAERGRRIAIIQANDPDRADCAHWRVRGMRASLSGRYNLDGIALDSLMLLGEPGDYDREPRFTAGAWRFCAVQLGGIEALLGEIREAMSDIAKADPVQRARFADATVAVRTAGFWVAEAAIRAAAGDPDAVTIARLARGVVERAGLDVMEVAARNLGTRSVFDGERADKIIRDLSLYLRQGGPDHTRDQAALALFDHDVWRMGDRLW
jgi:alkylation response protein AidB-like acyl-CoA dehydrogenase